MTLLVSKKKNCISAVGIFPSFGCFKTLWKRIGFPNSKIASNNRKYDQTIVCALDVVGTRLDAVRQYGYFEFSFSFCFLGGSTRTRRNQQSAVGNENDVRPRRNVKTVPTCARFVYAGVQCRRRGCRVCPVCGVHVGERICITCRVPTHTIAVRIIVILVYKRIAADDRCPREDASGRCDGVPYVVYNPFAGHGAVVRRQPSATAYCRV